MARLRKGVCYRRTERPYTRYSKFKQLNFIRSRPVCRIVKFDMGDTNKDYDLTFHLCVKDKLQIRDHALESARKTCNKLLEDRAGKGNYHFKIRVYPHHILRENPLATGAGADRMSTGMQKSFGKSIGIAAQLKEGQKLLTLRINKQHLKTARESLRRAARKLPCKCTIITE